MRPSARWPACARPSTTLTAAAIVTIALCLTACGASRKSLKSSTALHAESVSRLVADSTASVTETRLTAPVKIPASAVELEIPADSLHALPPGAVYTAKKGRASVKVSRRAPTATRSEVLAVTANCDSVEVLRIQYERKVESLKRQLAESAGASAFRQTSETSLEQRPDGVKRRLKLFLLGLLAGMASGSLIKRQLTTFIKKIKNYGK